LGFCKKHTLNNKPEKVQFIIEGGFKHQVQKEQRDAA
jgi:hypothetical protein